ncbi:exocyst subunit [Mucor velutinosus]|uniref:Exocyst subunit n=1 Tax=Mucor velutinosus TaxID=708070 RepID=A0AAN7I4X7_9FUNG|nr:exocyst subunit [Mucor velutinosus]
MILVLIGSLLIEAGLLQVEHAQLAMREGVTVQGVVYKASTSKESADLGCQACAVYTYAYGGQDHFFVDLMESLSYFGKVLQVKKFTHRGYFEGKLSVILDTSVGFQNALSERI